MKTLSPIYIKSTQFTNGGVESALITASRCRLRGVMIQRLSPTLVLSSINDTMVEFRNGTDVSGELIWNDAPPERRIAIMGTVDFIQEGTSWIDLPGIGVLFDSGLFINVTFDNAGTDANGDCGILVNVLYTGAKPI